MSKIDLDPITSGYNLSKINANFQKIKDELNNKVLYRDSPAGEPNSMSSNLDMNSRPILNASKISSNVLELGGVQVIPTSLAVDPYNGTREALRRSYAEAGYNLVGDFSDTGLVVNSAADVVLWEPTGIAYSYSGTLPHTVGAGETPIGSPLWVAKSTQSLRADIQVPDYAALRAYTGTLNSVYVTGVIGTANPEGIAGAFVLAANDHTRPDNGGTIIVDALGRRWIRVFTGAFDVRWFGATGDGITDDRPSIQSALDYVGSIGGGSVKIPKSSGQYRITSGLKLPGYVTLEGLAPDRFAFNSGAVDASCLMADFADPNQWVIESKATIDGLPIAYNRPIYLADAVSFVYNCGVKNLFIRAVNAVPFGGIRMQGCPGSIVDNVSVLGVGTGLFVNMTFGGNFSIHCLTKYYGVVCWSGCNANNFEVYCANEFPGYQTVPPAYVWPFMNALNGTMVPAMKLSTEAHYNRTWGLLIGGTPSDVSAGNRFDSTIERFSGGIFQYFSYGSSWGKCYMEGAADELDFGIVGTSSRFVVDQLHCYMSGAGSLFDLGNEIQGAVNPIGLLSFAGWGFGPFKDATSILTIHGMTAQQLSPATPQFNIVYTAGSKNWAAISLVNSWVNAGGGTLRPPSFRLNARTGNVELEGVINSGVDPHFSTIPVGYRPLFRCSLATTEGGYVNVDPDGKMYAFPGAGHTYVHLGGVVFEALQ